MADYLVVKRRLKPAEFNMLRRKVGWEEHAPADIRIAFRNTHHLVVAETKEHELVGMGRIIGDIGMYYYVQDVIVVPAHQGRGVGNLIMENLMDYIRKHMKSRLAVGLLSVQGKEEFYEKYGFTRRPTEGYGAGMIIEYE